MTSADSSIVSFYMLIFYTLICTSSDSESDDADGDEDHERKMISSGLLKRRKKSRMQILLSEWSRKTTTTKTLIKARLIVKQSLVNFHGNSETLCTGPKNALWGLLGSRNKAPHVLKK